MKGVTCDDAFRTTLANIDFEFAGKDDEELVASVMDMPSGLRILHDPVANFVAVEFQEIMALPSPLYRLIELNRARVRYPRLIIVGHFFSI
ncbi:hypothetical protein BBX50_10505 [Ensifer sp. LC11]|nr:hypothetical protein BBX50_10505 [Ensifer sp. LC11]